MKEDSPLTEQREPVPGEPTGPICYICLSPGADSEDHVIPESYFRPPRPSLLKLSAHYACHSRLDEDYPRLHFAAHAVASAAADTLWKGKVTRGVQRNARWQAELAASMIPKIDVVSPSGLCLGEYPAIRLDEARFYPPLEKMIRGLYRHHLGRFLARDVRFQWAINEPICGAKEEMFAAAASGLAFGDVFECRYLVVTEEDDTEGCVWWLRFYNGIVMRCYVTSTPAS